MRRMIGITLAGLVLAALAVAGWGRLAPRDPARWHGDPATIPDPATPNFARLDVVIDAPPPVVAARLERIARAEGAILLAGDGAHTTWITRTRLMGYPDYTTVRLTPEGESTRVVALARARFGRGDMGVNAARLARWLAAARQD